MYFKDTFKFTEVKRTGSLHARLSEVEAHAKEHRLRRSKKVSMMRNISSCRNKKFRDRWLKGKCCIETDIYRQFV